MARRPSAGAGRGIAETARARLGLERLRDGQREAVDAVLDGLDVLAVMPTGYGKSAVYQLAAALVDGPTVVVSPLLALQRDQVAAMAAAPDAPHAGALSSDTSSSETEETWKRLAAGGPQVLLLGPEQLAKDDVLDRLARAGVALLVVDEAHCVSSWGHDFRPDYLRLGIAADRLGRPPLLALTATAAPPVRDEIAERLGMSEPRLFVHGFDRPNIHLAARHL
ncbi:MAG: DEAD/DEAH box helicase, partial [Phycicoccus sp.]